MTDNTIWPPKPDLPDPLIEYDELIGKKLAASRSGRLGHSRFKLVRALHEEKGLGWLAALTVVESYRKRHTPPPNAKFFMALGIAASVFILPQFYQIYLKFHRGAILNQPNHRAALLALDQRIGSIDLIVFTFLALTCCALLSFFVIMLYQRRREK